MTATDELRRMLDERGVEWDGESYEKCTFWNEETNMAVASEGMDGKLWVSQSLTPAQAIAATLGVSDATQARHGDAGTCMEVYMLMATDIGDGREEVLGVYATEEAATAAINENQFGYAFHHVRKWEVAE